MIHITYDPQAHDLTLLGHAGAGVPGQDLICCAASMLTYALAANVRRMRRYGWLRCAAIRLQPGDARIRCQPADQFRDQVSARMEAVCLGYSLLAREYPDFVRFRITKKEEVHENANDS